MLLADVVAGSVAVAETRSRLSKVETIAGLLRCAGDNAEGEVEVVAAFLAGQPRHGRTGTGWRTLADLDVPAAAEPVLTVVQVDAALAELTGISGSGSSARRTELLRALLARATRSEQRFLFRLLTGELRQGAMEGVMADAVARASAVPGRAVRRAFMLTGQLPATAVAAMRGGESALAEFGLQLFRPIRPMLASPAASLTAALADVGEASVEYKLDGARIQVHRDGDEVHIYTRTLREITPSVPELVEVVRGLPCRSVVLDGETLALQDSGRPRPFQETMSRFGAQDPRDLLLRPYFFDCLHLDGDDLLDAPLRERLDTLHRIAGELMIPGVRRPSGQQAIEVFEAALAAGHEGVLVKALDSPYAAGRRGRSWQKIKPAHTVDLVVLAAEWGHGRRSGYLSNLHLGARDPNGGEPIMVGKTFKGMTDELLAWQTEALQQIATIRTQWAVHVRPELVVEIELDGIQASPRYPGGVALRFARVVRYRPDKFAAEADTIDTLRLLRAGADGEEQR